MQVVALVRATPSALSGTFDRQQEATELTRMTPNAATKLLACQQHVQHVLATLTNCLLRQTVRH